MEHAFTPQIKAILREKFGALYEAIYEKSPLLQYLNIKTVSATRGSKARGSFGNIYAVYVLVEDYVEGNFHKRGNYSNYAGAQFSVLFTRQRALPFGSKLQNHALNHRMNQEYKRLFPQSDFTPIMRDVDTNRYWINEHLLEIEMRGEKFNIAEAILEIVKQYIRAKQSAFDNFIETCENLKRVNKESERETREFIVKLLEPNVDARIFEIVSFSILKYFYREQIVFWGFDLDSIEGENLKLYKTGRTNANDGGIDFVMRPLGRFFQVTETLDVRKYFLDIDKIEHYPISFVIKSEEPVESLTEKLEDGARRQFPVETIVKRYLDCIEEVINIPALKERFDEVAKENHTHDILDEIVKQSKVEFNYEETEA